MSKEMDQVLDKLARDVELAVHAFYRGEVRQATAKVRTGHLVRDAAAALDALVKDAAAPDDAGSESARTPATSPSVAGAALGWTREDGEAVMKCVTSWLPMGAAATAPPDSKCIAAGREMVPTWGERERARAALRKLTPA